MESALPMPQTASKVKTVQNEACVLFAEANVSPLPIETAKKAKVADETNCASTKMVNVVLSTIPTAKRRLDVNYMVFVPFETIDVL